MTRNKRNVNKKLIELISRDMDSDLPNVYSIKETIPTEREQRVAVDFATLFLL